MWKEQYEKHEVLMDDSAKWNTGILSFKVKQKALHKQSKSCPSIQMYWLNIRDKKSQAR